MYCFKISSKGRFNIPFQKWYEFIAECPFVEWKITGHFETEPIGSWDNFDQSFDEKINAKIFESGFYPTSVSELKQIAMQKEKSIVWMKLVGNKNESTMEIWCFDGGYWLFKTNRTEFVKLLPEIFNEDDVHIEKDEVIW